MQEEALAGSVRQDLLERLRSLEGPNSAGSLSEIAYQRARDALTQALEEARSLRLRALDDARAMRESEVAALTAQLQSMRRQAEAEIDALLRTAEIEAANLRAQAKNEADITLTVAGQEAKLMREESHLLRAAAEERQREVERLEAEFNQLIERLTERLGVETVKPSRGWFRFFGRGKKDKK